MKHLQTLLFTRLVSNFRTTTRVTDFHFFFFFSFLFYLGFCLGDSRHHPSFFSQLQLIRLCCTTKQGKCARRVVGTTGVEERLEEHMRVNSRGTF